MTIEGFSQETFKNVKNKENQTLNNDSVGKNYPEKMAVVLSLCMGKIAIVLCVFKGNKQHCTRTRSDVRTLDSLREFYECLYVFMYVCVNVCPNPQTHKFRTRPE